MNTQAQTTPCPFNPVEKPMNTAIQTQATPMSPERFKEINDQLNAERILSTEREHAERNRLLDLYSVVETNIQEVCNSLESAGWHVEKMASGTFDCKNHLGSTLRIAPKVGNSLNPNSGISAVLYREQELTCPSTLTPQEFAAFLDAKAVR
jgi:hypothetical protein